MRAARRGELLEKFHHLLKLANDGSDGIPNTLYVVRRGTAGFVGLDSQAWICRLVKSSRRGCSNSLRGCSNEPQLEYGRFPHLAFQIREIPVFDFSNTGGQRSKR